MVSLNNLSHVCSNLVNCSRVRLGTTSISMTKWHLRFVLALQRQGLISTIEVGGEKPPAPPPLPSPESRLELANQLIESPWDAYPDPQSRQTPDRDENTLPKNPADLRLWLGLQYYQNKPVINQIEMISTPKRKITAKLPDIRRLVVGRGIRAHYSNTRSAHIEGVAHPGECIFMITAEGCVEARTAIEKKVGGLVLCRIW